MAAKFQLFACFWCQTFPKCKKFRDAWSQIQVKFPKNSLDFIKNRELELKNLAKNCGDFHDV
jgi:hypothetical protein